MEFLANSDPGFVHTRFLVLDMQKTIYTLKERSANDILAEPRIGRGKCWLQNLTNRDNLKV